MRSTLVSSATLVSSGRWDAGYHLALAEATERFPTWTGAQARAFLEPLALRLPLCVREALVPIYAPARGQRNDSRALTPQETLRAIRTFPLACLAVVVDGLVAWQAQTAADEALLVQARADQQAVMTAMHVDWAAVPADDVTVRA